MIVGKHSYVNSGLLDVLDKESAGKLSGLGKAATTIRKSLGNACSRKASSLHAVLSEVRHIHELDPDDVIDKFSDYIKAEAIRCKDASQLHSLAMALGLTQLQSLGRVHSLLVVPMPVMWCHHLHALQCVYYAYITMFYS